VPRGQTPGRDSRGRVQEALAAIRARDADLRAFITVRAEAEGEDGAPLAVKDLFDTAGLRTTYGSAIFRDHVPQETASSVARLVAAGHVVVGKTNLHEFAYGITSQNPHFGHVVNPLAPGRSPGGSSGGNAAALVTGMCELALGTDSGGSIRIPAACCGIAGFKPGHGLVPTDGVFPLAPSFDHAGPMARTAAACAEAMGIVVPGFRAADVDLADLRVGVAWLDGAAPGVRRRVDEAAARFPGRRHLDLPRPEGTYPAFMHEVADVHRDLFAEHAPLYGDNVRTKIERCLAVTDAEHEAALRARERYRVRAADAIEGLDLVLTPTLAFVAPSLADTTELELRDATIQLTFPFNALGWPAFALPCGPAEHGLPASVQLVGPPGSDELVAGAALALERAL
jgi:aspartyl-tRNA(Asn)/glutamyl-tRNA(Gln) amidotransferase subunit A